MHDSGSSHGSNGATSGAACQPHDARSFAEHGRQIRHDARVLAAAVQAAAIGLERYLTEQAARRPYATVGVAAGVGYTVGGGLGSRLTTMLLGATTRLAMALAARELDARLAHGAGALQRPS
jgi:ElaB/YqjD/DUF883 family membrane-anchored ribosome-binding protein